MNLGKVEYIAKQDVAYQKLMIEQNIGTMTYFGAKNTVKEMN